MEERSMRTHTCGELRAANIDTSVTLCGWVQKKRLLGSLNFFDLRDKFGLTQINFDAYPEGLELIKQIPLESVVQVKGIVRPRPSDAKNSKMETGEIEVLAKDLKLLSEAKVPPFLPSAQTEATEDLRLKYRYLEMRSEKFQEILKIRSETNRQTRGLLYGDGFIEVETPILYKTTPEGARDFLVPSRTHRGKVYALPQSPQTLKQILMMGGTDRYFQICRCFRDEDFRADRQPEFTQLDLEISFTTEAEMKSLAQKLVAQWFPVGKDFELPEMSYQQAMQDYGCDRPDTRFQMLHHNFTEQFLSSEMSLFKGIAKEDGLIKGIFLSKKEGELSRKEIDSLSEITAPFGGKGVAWLKREGPAWKGSLAKFATGDFSKKLEELTAEDGLWLFQASQSSAQCHASTDALRRHLGDKFQLYQKDFAFLWVNQFPLFEYNDQDERFYAVHHPFTAPLDNDEERTAFFSDNSQDWKSLKAQAYDLVCNGMELGGGSLRIFDPKMQTQMFKILGLSEEEANKQFGFFLEALQYGTPPHGGMAFGMDRIVMIQTGSKGIREVIAFPKSSSGMDLMASTPSTASDIQLKDLGLKWASETTAL